MSGIASGVTRVFSTVGSAVARVGSAVANVGSTLFTAGAASGAGSIASGGLAGIIQNFTGSGVLGNILTGAITQAGYGALIGGAISALTGGDFLEGAKMGGLSGAVSGGLFGAAGLNPDPLTKGFGQPPAAQSGIQSANTTTGVAATGQTFDAPSTIPGAPDARVPMNISPSAAAPAVGTPVQAAQGAAQGGGGGFGQFLQSETGGSLIKGLGQGLGSYMQSKQQREMMEQQLAAAAARDEATRDYDREQYDRVQRSYNIGPEALHGPVNTTGQARPTPGEKFRRPRYRYDRSTGEMVFG